MEFQDWMFDKRVLRRNIRKGIITRDDYLKYLEGLEDVADNIAEDEAIEEQEPEKDSQDAPVEDLA